MLPPSCGIVDTAEQARQRDGVKLGSARMREGGWLFAAAITIGCNAEPAPNVVSAKLACEQLREDFRTGECLGVSVRGYLLRCEEAPPDDPACVEQAPAREACVAKVAEFGWVHDSTYISKPQLADPANWACEYPPSPPSQRADRRGKGPARPLPQFPPLPVGELIMAACTDQYTRLRDLPNVDRAVLEQVWRSDECRRRHETVLGALEGSPVAHDWAVRWINTWVPRTEPWRLPQDMDALARVGITADLDTWCAEAPCRVLGRCSARELSIDHPTFPGALTCVALDDAACERSQACAAEGRCRLDATLAACVPADDDDCARSALCKERGLCRRIDDPPFGASCGGTLPATSGADVIGFVNNPALGKRVAVLEIESESIEGLHAEVMAGLSPEQLADVSACVAVELAVVPTLDSSVRLVVDINGAIPSLAGINGPDSDASWVFDRCIERKAAAWKFPAAEGTSRLSFLARTHGR
jgi:hypothetical protein